MLCNDDTLREEIKGLMVRMSKLDFGEPLPSLDPLFINVWAEHYARIIRLAEPEHCSLTLEIGLGYGIIASVLGDRKEQVVTTEHPSRAYLWKKDYRRLLENKGLTLVANDLSEGLPFGSDSFQKVLYCDVIEHFSPQIVNYQIEEIARVLKLGGVLIFSTPNLARLANRLEFLKGRIINPPLEVRKVGETFDHIREYLWEELIGAFQKVGFVQERMEYGWIPYFNGDSPKCLINRLTELMLPILPKLGDEFYVRMRKK